MDLGVEGSPVRGDTIREALQKEAFHIHQDIQDLPENLQEGHSLDPLGRVGSVRREGIDPEGSFDVVEVAVGSVDPEDEQPVPFSCQFGN